MVAAAVPPQGHGRRNGSGYVTPTLIKSPPASLSAPLDKPYLLSLLDKMCPSNLRRAAGAPHAAQPETETGEGASPDVLPIKLIRSAVLLNW